MIKFGDKSIGTGSPCFLTLEAGPTHDGLQSAKDLVSIAAKGGGDAVKFQILDPDRLVADRKQLFTYEVLVDSATDKRETVSEPLYDILCRRALTPDEWIEVKAHADACKLAFFATIGFEDEIDLLERLGCHSLKVASADVTHFPLLRKAAKSGMSIQLDTGSSTIGEVEAAVDVILSEGNDQIIIHHCPSGYPAHLESINLSLIPVLKQIFLECAIAYSDHSPGWEMDVAAIALGADLVEKTITHDRTTRSVEHIMSLERDDIDRFVRSVRDIETALGSPRRNMSVQERIANVRRSVFLRRDVSEGERLGDADIEFRRPGRGLTPIRYEQLLGLSSRTAMKAGSMVHESDLLQGE
ncbi:N-acetylneuraminate synthase family protein [Roseobacter litoralis]|uniref:N-acetylneuraminate synthase family protein n=1 Tax=Roseobacter litoralis TaxID=42443 RepID=UPI002495A45E|nr:N-acetylneuraminate synthase family protein [Roseobacter litoralis]